MPMELTKIEQETIILYNEEEPTANVYTHDPKLTEKLARLSDAYPEQIKPGGTAHEGAVSYTVPKKLVSIRAPVSASRRDKLREHQKNTGAAPPPRKKMP